MNSVFFLLLGDIMRLSIIAVMYLAYRKPLIFSGSQFKRAEVLLAGSPRLQKIFASGLFKRL